jgi:hypothetical protein
MLLKWLKNKLINLLRNYSEGLRGNSNIVHKGTRCVRVRTRR